LPGGQEEEAVPRGFDGSHRLGHALVAVPQAHAQPELTRRHDPLRAALFFQVLLLARTLDRKGAGIHCWQAETLGTFAPASGSRREFALVASTTGMGAAIGMVRGSTTGGGGGLFVYM